MTKQIICLIVSFILTAILGKIIIPILKKLKVGQSERLDGPRAHLKKQGTPTMGGIMMIISITIITLIYCLVAKDNVTNILAILLASIGFGIVGFIDDFKKVVLKNTEGLNPKLKMLGLLIISAGYTMFLVNYSNIGTDIIIPILNYNLVLPLWIYIPFTILVMLSATNAVNLTDGLDGLAGGLSAIAFIAFSLISLMVGFEDIGIFSLILVGSLMGYLIYNTHPAKVIMGDTGSLALGATMGAIAILTHRELTLLVVAGIFVIETLSVILQTFWVQVFHKKLFLMTPIHHHFEKLGWEENDIVKLFWVGGLLLAMAGIIFGVWL